MIGRWVMAEQRRYLTARDLADRFGVSLYTIGSWRRQRILPAPLRLGRQPLWLATQLDQFEADRLADAQRAAEADGSETKAGVENENSPPPPSPG